MMFVILVSLGRMVDQTALSDPRYLNPISENNARD
jgi:hypothetical protein